MKKIISEATPNSAYASNKTPVQDKSYAPYMPVSRSSGLADLQQATRNILSSAVRWGFANSNLKVKRHKLDNQNWQLTVVNPKTRKTILQAEGHGDTVFANEDNLARMAEMLMQQGLTIRTQFDD